MNLRILVDTIAKYKHLITELNIVENNFPKDPKYIESWNEKIRDLKYRIDKLENIEFSLKEEL